jgi:hypothetical protein
MLRRTTGKRHPADIRNDRWWKVRSRHPPRWYQQVPGVTLAIIGAATVCVGLSAIVCHEVMLALANYPHHATAHGDVLAVFAAIPHH